MLIAGQLLLQAGSPLSGRTSRESGGRCRIAPGMVRLRDGQIEEVIEGEISAKADVGSKDCLIAPGFIDTHLHLPQFDMIGGHGLPLLEWLAAVTFPSEMKWSDLDFACEMTSRVVGQCFAHGTTAICAYATVHHESAAAALRIAADAGMRGVIGQVLMDRGAPRELLGPADRSIDQVAEMLDRFPPESRMAAAVTPRFAISCTAGLMEQAGRLAAERMAVVQTHLAETIPECVRVSELFDGRSYVDVYDEAGLIGPRSIFGHGIHLNQADRKRIAAQRAAIAHCPTANSFLRSGTMHRQSLIDDSVSITLGSDIGAGYERSMVRVARAMIESAALIGDQFPDAATAWHAITAGNADGLGWTDAGRLIAGASADLVVIRPDVPWLNTPVDPLARLMFSWDDRWIDSTIVRGEVVYRR